MLIITLTDDASDLLQMYALPHVHREGPQPKNDAERARVRVAFAELRDKGMVREGIGNALVFDESVVLTGNESKEEMAALLKPHMIATPGWVVTERGMNWIADKVQPKDREKAIAIMRFYIVDKDPAAAN